MRRALLSCFLTIAAVGGCDQQDQLPITAPAVWRGGVQPTVVGATVIVLPTLGGTPPTIADINDAGQVVGTSTTATGQTRAFLWTPAGGMRDLGTLGGGTSRATAINEAGQVVGMSGTTIGKGETHAFLWTPGVGMQDLGTRGAPLSSALGINARGHVVGNNIRLGLFNRAFLWTPEQGMQDLVALAGGFASALAINDSELIVGSVNLEGGSHAVLWTAEGAIHDLGTLDGASTLAVDINESGQVIGYAGFGEQPRRAFSWIVSQGMRDLGTLGGPSSEAYAINDRGQVVGTTTAADGVAHAFLWTAADGMTDLLAATGMSAAVAINNRGQVAGGDRVATLQFQADEGSFVSGSGFIRVASLSKNKAHFTFNVSVLTNPVAPNGRAKFWVPGGSLDFESTAIEALTISGNRTQFWGTGTLGRVPARFRITAVDGNPAAPAGTNDAFRIELWQAGTLVFDSQPGTAPDAPVTTAIEGGNVQIHR